MMKLFFSSKWNNIIFHTFNRVVFYYYTVLFFILCILAIICASYFIVSNERFPMNEIEDSPTFNQIVPDIAKGMLYDMSYSQRYYSIKLPVEFSNLIDSEGVFLDIGSGGGEASIFHLQNFFGENVKIILSDLHPKVELWNKLTTKNISYIKEPVDATNLPNICVKTMTCFGSLHHMDEKTIRLIFSQIREKNITMFIVEPRRFPNIIQFLHILTLPIFGFLSYNMISLFGSAITSDGLTLSQNKKSTFIQCPNGHSINDVISFGNSSDFIEQTPKLGVCSSKELIDGISRFLLVPFFMTWDHILGASRRYSLEEIENLVNEQGLKMVHHSDIVFNYYIIKPFTCIS